MHLDVYELILFKVDTVTDFAKLCILILISVTLTLIQGISFARIKNFCTNYLTKFSIDLEGIRCAIET